MRFVILWAAACLSVATAFSPGPAGLFTAPGLRSGGAEKREGVAPLRMGLFDGISKAFNDAMSNEELPPPPPDGLSEEPWMNGMKRSIAITFENAQGEVLATTEGLPGDSIQMLAKKAGVAVGGAFTLFANDAQVSASSATRLPAPTRRNAIADDALSSGKEMFDSGLTAPVFTNYASRGEVRTVTKVKNAYKIIVL
mmetsp:Transcript_28467/g.67959  ORF Transcript_28467/g.67959 Transcript_28467/m.67959 type:complete len:197 (-) Transcript_28467:167-757(-)